METLHLITQWFYNIMIILVLPLSIWIWTPHFNKPDKKVRNITITLVFYHLMVLAELGVGNFGWALMWLGCTVLWMIMRKKYKETRDMINEFKDEVNKRVINQIAEDFELDPKDFSIVDKSHNEVEIHYKGKIFNAAEHKRPDGEDK